MSEFKMFYYTDLVLMQGVDIVHATIPHDPVRRRHARRYAGLEDAKRVIERGRRCRYLLNQWTWTTGSLPSPHIAVHNLLNGGIRAAIKPPSVKTRRTPRMIVKSQSWLPPHAYIFDLVTRAAQTGLHPTEIDRIIAIYGVKRAARSAYHQGFPKADCHVYRAAVAAVLGTGRLESAIDVLTGGVHQQAITPLWTNGEPIAFTMRMQMTFER